MLDQFETYSINLAKDQEGESQMVEVCGMNYPTEYMTISDRTLACKDASNPFMHTQWWRTGQLRTEVYSDHFTSFQLEGTQQVRRRHQLDSYLVTHSDPIVRDIGVSLYENDYFNLLEAAHYRKYDPFNYGSISTDVSRAGLKPMFISFSFDPNGPLAGLCDVTKNKNLCLEIRQFPELPTFPVDGYASVPTEDPCCRYKKYVLSIVANQKNFIFNQGGRMMLRFV